MSTFNSIVSTIPVLSTMENGFSGNHRSNDILKRATSSSAGCIFPSWNWWHSKSLIPKNHDRATTMMCKCSVYVKNTPFELRSLWLRCLMLLVLFSQVPFGEGNATPLKGKYCLWTYKICFSYWSRWERECLAITGCETWNIPSYC